LVSLKLNYLSHLSVRDNGSIAGELLLDDFEDLLLVKLLGETLDCSQGLASIALCNVSACVTQSRRLKLGPRDGRVAESMAEAGGVRTLNTDMNVILRLLGLSGIFVGFGEGVCRGWLAFGRSAKVNAGAACGWG
jgi:hypothetical protein